MPPNLAMLIGISFVLFVYWLEGRRNVGVSKALFWPCLWYAVVTTRPVGTWFYMWGLPLPGGGGDATDGSLIDRLFYAVLAVIGAYILHKRNFDWAAFRRENKWFMILFVFMGLSVLWSDYSMVSFKRFIKVIGSAIMALVVLTEEDRMVAISAFIRRCVYFHVPLSIIFIRYFRELAIERNEFTGHAVAWIGLATSKNTLGQVAMTSALYFVWYLVRTRGQREWRWLNYLYLAMSLYLLKGGESSFSMTSVSVFLLGLVVFLALGHWRWDARVAGLFFKTTACAIFGMLIFIMVHAVVHFKEDSAMGWVIIKMGRDLTFTGRTDIWSDVFAVANRNPLFGVGYGGFWIGRMANIPWNEHMSWVLGQAHDGYVDIFLQIGWVGIAIFAAYLFSIMNKLISDFPYEFEYTRFRMLFYIVIIYINITESTFLRGDHNIWLLFLVISLVVPVPETQAEWIVESAEYEEPEPESNSEAEEYASS